MIIIVSCGTHKGVWYVRGVTLGILWDNIKSNLVNDVWLLIGMQLFANIINIFSALIPNNYIHNGN